MSIQDVLKKSFLSQFNSDLSTTSIVGALILTALIGTYIFVIYRAVCRKAFYSKSLKMERAFADAGYDVSYGRVTVSNRPDLCEYQCNGALAAAKQYHGFSAPEKI